VLLMQRFLEIFAAGGVNGLLLANSAIHLEILQFVLLLGCNVLGGGH
jgi:heme/copper-type cytochrome/quinol oxidase subunit 1